MYKNKVNFLKLNFFPKKNCFLLSKTRKGQPHKKKKNSHLFYLFIYKIKK